MLPNPITHITIGFICRRTKRTITDNGKVGESNSPEPAHSEQVNGYFSFTVGTQVRPLVGSIGTVLEVHLITKQPLWQNNTKNIIKEYMTENVGNTDLNVKKTDLRLNVY